MLREGICIAAIDFSGRAACLGLLSNMLKQGPPCRQACNNNRCCILKQGEGEKVDIIPYVERRIQSVWEDTHRSELGGVIVQVLSKEPNCLMKQRRAIDMIHTLH